MTLQEKRLNKGLSQSQLAKVVGISTGVLQAYEQGLRDISGAKLKTLLKLALELDCEVSEIVNDPELIELLKYKGAN